VPEPEQPARPANATALRYEAGSTAPKVAATGRGLVAERIVEEAGKAGVPIRHDAALAEALGGLQLGHEVPEELWAAVAEALAWAYALDARAARTRDQA
jgi:type III secretion system FlhB-like substrate exporter